MSVSSNTPRVTYNGNGVSTAFAVAYFLTDDDLVVYVGGVLKMITTDYTLSGAGISTGGTVTFLTAPPAGTANVLIINDPSLLQSTQLPSNDPFPSKSVENALDKLTILVQRVRDLIGRSFVLPDSDTSGASPILPTPAATTLIGWNSTATALINYAAGLLPSLPVSAYIQTLLDDPDAATARTTLGAGVGDATKAAIQAQTYTAFTTGGTSSAYTGTLAPAIAAYAAPLRFFATLHTPPSGSPTIALNGLAAKNWKYVDQNGVKQFITAAVTPTQTDNTYDGTDVVLMNPLRVDIGNIQVAARQSVQYGPITAAGQPDLIPQSQVGNTIAAGVTLKGSTAAFFASVGAGFNTDGSQKNINRVRSTDLTIASLTASATNYIYYDPAADTAGFVTVADAFQAGGTIPVTNNQYTYDYLNHIMYIGNGSVATATSRIIVAEVDTNATVVIAVRSRAYAGKYDSGFTATLTGAAGAYSKNHNIGTSEITVAEVIECTTNDNGYVVGDRIVSPMLGFNGGATYPPVDNVGKNIVTRRFVSGASYTVPNGGTGAAANLTLASWKYKMTAARKF